MLPFLVGSHVYGTPRPDSDIDLVIRMTPEVATRLYELAGQSPDGPLRFGALNLIPALDDEQYAAWVKGLEQVMLLRQAGSVSCAVARDVFRTEPAIHGTPSCTVPFTPDGDPVPVF